MSAGREDWRFKRVRAPLHDAPRPGRPRVVTLRIESKIVRRALCNKLLDAAHWSTPS